MMTQMNFLQKPCICKLINKRPFEEVEQESENPNDGNPA
jgi:hypothetical protein